MEVPFGSCLVKKIFFYYKYIYLFISTIKIIHLQYIHISFINLHYVYVITNIHVSNQLKKKYYRKKKNIFLQRLTTPPNTFFLFLLEIIIYYYTETIDISNIQNSYFPYENMKLKITEIFLMNYTNPAIYLALLAWLERARRFYFSRLVPTRGDISNLLRRWASKERNLTIQKKRRLDDWFRIYNHKKAIKFSV